MSALYSPSGTAAVPPAVSVPVAGPRIGYGPALRRAVQAASIVACLVLWHVAATRHVDLGLVTFANVPPPREVIGAAWALLQSPKLLNHLGSSLLRIAVGYGLAAFLGVALGLLIGRLRVVHDVLM